MDIREAYEIVSEHNGRHWVSLDAIHEMTGMSIDEITRQVTEIKATDSNFRIEKSPTAHMFGRQPEYLICWNG